MSLRKMQDRTKSGFDLSIGTGMALEAVFNATHEVYDTDHKPKRIALEKYDVFAVNWYTIIRNVIESLDKDTKHKVFKGSGNIKDDLIAVANMEIETIAHLCANEDIELVVLAPNYKKLKPFVFNDKLTQKTDTMYIALTSIDRIKYDYEDNHNPKYGNMLLLTHMPFDLLINKSKVDILQSHTGEILPKHMYNKKYRKTSMDTSFLPFNSLLLYLLADDTGLLKLIDRNARKDAIETLAKNAVTQTTTYSRVRTILMRSKYASDFIKTFNNPY